MSLELILSGSAVLISVISFIYTIWSTKRQEYLNALSDNISRLSEIELMIAENPKLLELHGVSVEDLEEAGITEKEFAYLLANFTAGGLYYRAASAGKEPFQPDTYRYNLLKSSYTRKAWPFLRKFIQKSPYSEKIEKTIDLIESEESRD